METQCGAHLSLIPNGFKLPSAWAMIVMFTKRKFKTFSIESSSKSILTFRRRHLFSPPSEKIVATTTISLSCSHGSTIGHRVKICCRAWTSLLNLLKTSRLRKITVWSIPMSYVEHLFWIRNTILKYWITSASYDYLLKASNLFFELHEHMLQKPLSTP